jgi:uncharacterized protein (TIGR03435 family)
MRRMLRSILTLIVLSIPAGINAQNAAQAQSDQSTSPSFSVASVKRNNSGAGFVTALPQPGGVNFVNIPLRQVIDILAKSDAPPVPGQTPLMLRNLLADRFKLVVRSETRERPIYALVLARVDGRLGPRLHKSTADCAAANAALARGAVPPEANARGGRSQCGGGTRPGQIAMGGMSMAQLSGMLSQFLQRIVVDSTGLAGAFDIDLTWAADGPQTSPVDADAASIFSALQEQLGLKLEPRQGPVPVVVIERVEQPTEN